MIIITAELQNLTNEFEIIVFTLPSVKEGSNNNSPDHERTPALFPTQRVK